MLLCPRVWWQVLSGVRTDSYMGRGLPAALGTGQSPTASEELALPLCWLLPELTRITVWGQ